MTDTEVGGIKGFLSLDDTAWDRTIAKAKQDIRELGAMDADVRVDADTDRAERRIAVLHAAVRELGAESVTVRVNVAQRSSGSSAGTQAAVDIEEQLAEAQSKVAIASMKADLAQQRLNEAEEKGTRTASELIARSASRSLRLRLGSRRPRTARSRSRTSSTLPALARPARRPLLPPVSRSSPPPPGSRVPRRRAAAGRTRRTRPAWGCSSASSARC